MADKTHEVSFGSFTSGLDEATMQLTLEKIGEEINEDSRLMIVNALTFLDEVLTGEEHDLLRKYFKIFGDADWYLDNRRLHKIREVFGDRQEEIIERINRAKELLSPLTAKLSTDEIHEIQEILHHIIAPLWSIKFREIWQHENYAPL